MAKHRIRKTNPQLMLQIDAFKAHARQHQANIWRDTARRLEAPSNNYAKVNLSRLNRHTNSGDIVIVAGKVLGAGSIDHPISIGAPSLVITPGQKSSRREGPSCRSMKSPTNLQRAAT